MKLLLIRRITSGMTLLILMCACLNACSLVEGKDGHTELPDNLDPKVWRPIAYDTSKKYIYLSFDDGPQPGTVTCIDLCKKEHVKASFFMVGLHCTKKTDGHKIVSTVRESYPQLLLANHSYSHALGKYPFFYHHPAMAEADFLKAQDSLQVPYKILRLPGNSAWAENGALKASGLVKPVTHMLDSAGYNVIGWDLEWCFRHKNARPIQTPAKLIEQIDSAFAQNKTHTRNHLVLLAHDRMFRRTDDADSLAKFITLLKQDRRFVFETVDHYPGVIARK